MKFSVVVVGDWFVHSSDELGEHPYQKVAPFTAEFGQRYEAISLLDGHPAFDVMEEDCTPTPPDWDVEAYEKPRELLERFVWVDGELRYSMQHERDAIAVLLQEDFPGLQNMRLEGEVTGAFYIRYRAMLGDHRKIKGNDKYKG